LILQHDLIRKALQLFGLERFCRVMKRLTLVFNAILVAALLAGCSGYRPAPAAINEALNQPYRLGAGDKVRVTVFEQESLTNTYSVDQSGYVAFPLIGAVPARGTPCSSSKARSRGSSATAICVILM
jgi:protein involved in polysaccharide export with SLBB domain